MLSTCNGESQLKKKMCTIFSRDASSDYGLFGASWHCSAAVATASASWGLRRHVTGMRASRHYQSLFERFVCPAYFCQVTMGKAKTPSAKRQPLALGIITGRSVQSGCPHVLKSHCQHTGIVPIRFQTAYK